ncbi:MAG: riboflavin synthase [Myxococcota bacterium]|nr:riboflavin synthase [Myxococcota bacterium]
MFTGIVAAIGEVRSVAGGGGETAELRIRGPWPDLETGESAAVDGACLTVVSCARDGTFAATASGETRSRTTLGKVRAGSKVHLERAMRLSDRLGGHLVTGHVDAVGRVVSAQDVRGGTRRLVVEIPSALSGQVVEKGSIAVDGVSLTVNSVVDCTEGLLRFEAAIVPYTAAATKFGAIRAGAEVNVETDVIAKYVQRALGRGPAEALTLEALQAAGFVGGGRGR